MKIVVGSENPSKIEAVRSAFSLYFTDFSVHGEKTESGVSAQPMNSDEMYRGAKNRAAKALTSMPDAEFGVGLEGGLHKYPHGWVEQTVVVILSKKGEVGFGVSAGFEMPPKIFREIQKGRELAHVVDDLFQTQDSGRKEGFSGILTKSKVTRQDQQMHAIVYALARFINPHIYSEDGR